MQLRPDEDGIWIAKSSLLPGCHAHGRAFGFERMLDTLGAIVGPATAFVLLPWLGHHYPTLFALTLNC